MCHCMCHLKMHQTWLSWISGTYNIIVDCLFQLLPLSPPNPLEETRGRYVCAFTPGYWKYIWLYSSFSVCQQISIMASQLLSKDSLFLKMQPKLLCKNWLHCMTALKLLEHLLLLLKFTDPVTDIPTTCHHVWGGEEITRRMSRKVREAVYEAKN